MRPSKAFIKMDLFNLPVTEIMQKHDINVSNSVEVMQTISSNEVPQDEKSELYYRDVKIIDLILNDVANNFDAFNSLTLLNLFIHNDDDDENQIILSERYFETNKIMNIINDANLPFLDRINECAKKKTGNCGVRANFALKCCIEMNIEKSIKVAIVKDFDHQFLIFDGLYSKWLIDPWICRYYICNIKNISLFMPNVPKPDEIEIQIPTQGNDIKQLLIKQLKKYKNNKSPIVKE